TRFPVWTHQIFRYTEQELAMAHFILHLCHDAQFSFERRRFRCPFLLWKRSHNFAHAMHRNQFYECLPVIIGHPVIRLDFFASFTPPHAMGLSFLITACHITISNRIRTIHLIVHTLLRPYVYLTSL